MANPPTPDSIGAFQIVRSLGKGGMGEVFLAFDPICKREVAVKKMRADLKNHTIIRDRFLREARVAAHLTHPSIIPIFSIAADKDNPYYTMPYIEGETLKEILKAAYSEEKEGKIRHPIGESVPTLVRIFLNVCEAVAYTHSKGILHRDLKPDNVMVGKYGEVMIFDWGLADFIGREEPTFSPSGFDEDKDLTSPGKVPGTLNYLAPERVEGRASTPQTDIYALGVILYQILTLRLPFQRTSTKHFRKTMHLEKVLNPIEVAPYRDIPQHLADIAKRCLCASPEERFYNVDEMIVELKSFIEGKPEWVPLLSLNMSDKKDWEFQENILLTRHLAITRAPDVMEWVSLMISAATFSGNLRLETKIKMNPGCQGVGILFCIASSAERNGLEEGYCLMLEESSACLFHSQIEVMKLPDSRLEDHGWHAVRIEKIDNHLYIFLDDTLKCHYVSHIPMTGPHVGLLSYDEEFEMTPITLSIGSQNAMVSCLAVPDAFLANKNYAKALVEYRRIVSSFAGRAEGREALFRAGITLLEESISKKKNIEKEQLRLLALEEFGKLRFTPGAPLEYLGKSLVYKAANEIEEECKCLELCLRKYPKHPLLNIVIEHIAFRLHESSARDRIAAYHFALLALRHLSHIFQHTDHERLIESLRDHLEPLPFFIHSTDLAHQLSFWLAKPITLIEILEHSALPIIASNALYALLMLGFKEWVKENLHLCSDKRETELLEIALLSEEKGPKAALEALTSSLNHPICPSEVRCALYLFDEGLKKGKSQEILPFFESFEPNVSIDALHLWALLLENQWKKAEDLITKCDPSILTDEYSPLYVPTGCFLRHTEGKAIAISHFSGSLDLPHPPTSMLLSYFLCEKGNGWLAQALPWEKIQLYRQLHLYYHCAGKEDKALHYLKCFNKEIKSVQAKYTYP